MADLDKLSYVSSNNKAFVELRNNIKLNTKEYTILKGDTFYSVAKNLGIKVEDLISLNKVLGVEIKFRGKNPILNIGNKINIPNDLAKFRSDLQEINKVVKELEKNKKFNDEGVDDIVENREIFPRKTQSIGLRNMLESEVNSEKIRMPIARNVLATADMEKKASCAHHQKQKILSSMAMEDIDQRLKKVLLKEGVDAWELPTELMGANFDQKINIMNSFDESKLGQENPIGDQKLYDEGISKINEYLKKTGVSGTFVPLYFRHSRKKDDIAVYNRTRKADKHFNTHQIMFNKNDSIEYKAFEAKDYSTGKGVLFGVDKEKIKEEIEILNKEINQIKDSLGKTKKSIIFHIDLKSNPELKARDKALDRAILISTDKNEEKKNKIKDIILKTDDTELWKSEIFKIIKIRQTKEDIDYFIALKKNYTKVLKSISFVSKNIQTNSEINGGLGYRLDANKDFTGNISKYNKDILNLRKKEETIKSLVEKSKEVKRISLIDYIANFIQERLDHGEVAFSLETRKRVIEGIKKYPHLIKLKLNGQVINLKDEIARINKTGKGIIFVTPDSKVEFSGPIMSDGEIRKAHGGTKMEARVRFLFEFLVSGDYFASEVLEPNEKSSVRKKKFGNFSDELIAKYEYSLDRGESIDSVLKKRIPIYEKDSFSKLDKTSKNYSKDYQKLLNYFYELQIKALQLKGVIQDENTINPGSVKINKTLIYWDTKNVSTLFNKYILEKKTIIENSSDKLKNLRTFIPLNIYYGDTEEILFERFIKNLKGINLDNYPNLKNVATLSFPIKKEFIKKVCFKAYDKKGKLKAGQKISISYEKLDKIAYDLINIKTSLNIPNLGKLDDFIIDNTASNETSKELLKNALYREKYYKPENKFDPSSLKSYAKLFIDRKWLKKTFESKTSSLGDFQIQLTKFDEKSWFNKTTLSDAIAKLDDPKIKSRIDTFTGFEQGVIKYDLQQIGDVKSILSKKEISSEDVSLIYSKLKYILRQNTKDNTNYVGSVISTVLLQAKLNDHSEKLAGMLSFSGENIEDIYSDKNLKKAYEQSILTLNNLTETTSLLAFCENYLLRIMNNGLNLKLETKDVYSKSLVDSSLGKLDYDKKVFLNHFSDYRKVLVSKSFNTKEEKSIVSKIEKFYFDLDEANINSNNKKFLETIYDFVKDKEIKDFLAKNNLPVSILPDKKELKATNFQKSVFTYANKFDS